MEFLNAFSHLDWAQVLQLTGQHITLVGIAVILAILIGVPLGILMTRFPTLAGPLQAVPAAKVRDLSEIRSSRVLKVLVNRSRKFWLPMHPPM